LDIDSALTVSPASFCFGFGAVLPSFGSLAVAIGFWSSWLLASKQNCAVA